MRHGLFYVSVPGGWYWEEWTDGELVKRGWHNGTCPPGRDASWQHTELCYSITATAFNTLYE